ncbi:VOC family protein [Mycolicibacterium smegmatis]|uniref:2,3-dihydroxybiphenyl 1,2-dioxygenase n=3 Tax=Mycolicibacterium smegmatis TaxID=1772 RepID=I7FZ89_MYCS2|nr:VOC family protein [Mycolicibacterium smegmatis]ABK71883.1 2,3-dihydroxybiphenyl 1,2-dioxygenase [Mycolicibacterium smegmatis MC2 155]AFP38432.1 2,3-dihydroxybiphenyl 1,2-dioxygenase [Mycolicibacterium smegmatis MC2 155]AIU07221.1 dioxygenase [Mycolicibacterium smegmatis MC2 155]AIU13846.1 dioxygenase [Mycolicibacterium smegmatis]AIU20470.1 dioxygenase [Mycolicibacterium smegmatis]
MALHRLDSIVLGVPDLAAAATFYEDFGLIPHDGHRFASTEGGVQLELVHSARRRLVSARFAVDDDDDLQRAARELRRSEFAAVLPEPGRLHTVEPTTGAEIELITAPRLDQAPYAAPPVNAPGRNDRVDARAAGIMITDRVRPRRLGHIVIGSPDYETAYAFFVSGLGFKVSDLVKGHGAFLRCSTDHHNVLLQRAPVPFLHHSSWQVDDVDAIGRGAMALLEDHPERHVWGLGRHYAGSNFFWYFKDPANNFAEYHSDMDCIVDDALWTPEELEGARGLYQWGPPPPASFLHPEDLAEHMIHGHSG